MDKHSAPPGATVVLPTHLERLERLRHPLVGFLFALLGDVNQARAITQEVFVQASSDAGRDVPPVTGDGSDEAIRRWLFGLAYRRVVSVRRFAPRDECLGMPPAVRLDGARQPLSFDDQCAEGTLLRTTLAAMGPRDAACLLLTAVHGFSVEQLAALLELAPAAVKKRMAHARRRLRDAYFAARPMP